MSEEKKSTLTRRKFIKAAAVGTAAAAALATSKSPLVGKAEAAAMITPPHPDIKDAPEFTAAYKAALPDIKFPTSVANVFAMCAKAQGLAAFIHCPGNYGLQDAIVNQGIPAYGGRHDGAMGHGCDAFYRVSGEIAAINAQYGGCTTLGTSAYLIAEGACSPMMILSGEGRTTADEYDRAKGWVNGAWRDEATFQGVTCYSHTVTTPGRIWEHTSAAFRHMRSGVPKPAYLGFPSDVAGATIRSTKELTYYFDKARTSTDTEPYPDPKAIAAAADMLKKAQRPIIVIGHGVWRTRAFDILQKFAEKTQIPVTEGGAQQGKFSQGHPLCASMSHKAYESADLVLLVGYYKIPGIGGFAFDPAVKYIRIHPETSDIGRQLPIEVGIVSGEKAALEALYEAMPSMKHDTWIAEIRKAEVDYEAEKTAMEAQVASLWKDVVHPAHIGKGMADFLQKGKIPRDEMTFVSGGFGIARFVRPYIRAYRPGQILTGPYWEIVVGPDVAYTVGVGMAMEIGAGMQKAYKGGPVVMDTGDAGIGITAMEMATLRKYHVPAVCIVWSNNTWGTWRGKGPSPADGPNAPRQRREHPHLYQENIRYDLLASALGCYGAYVKKPEDFLPALESCYNVAVRERIPSLICCQGRKESLTNDWPPSMWGAPRPGAMSYHY